MVLQNILEYIQLKSFHWQGGGRWFEPSRDHYFNYIFLGYDW